MVPTRRAVKWRIRKQKVFYYQELNPTVKQLTVPNKKIKMKKIIVRSDMLFLGQFKKFCDNISFYQKLLDITDEQVTAIKAAYHLYQYIMDVEMAMNLSGVAVTACKNWIKDGPSSQPLTPFPPLFVYPVPIPVFTSGNVVSQFAKITDDCIKSPNFSNAIGIALGIYLATEERSDTVAVIKPPLTAKISPAGHPILHSKKGIYQGYQVYKDSGDGKLIEYKVSMQADFIDNADLPVTGITKVWRYKIIYLQANKEIGNFSDIISVTVMSVE